MWFSSELAKVKFPLNLGFLWFLRGYWKGIYKFPAGGKGSLHPAVLVEHREQAIVFHMEITSSALSIFLPSQELAWLYPTLLFYHKWTWTDSPDPGKNTKYRDIRQDYKQIIDLFNSFKNPFNNQVPIYSAHITHLSASCELFMNEVFCSMTFILTPRVELSTAVISALRN